ncbi:hypothetical protein [Nitrosococcus halophilus]|nr:hypothetical protein [Nitrosococcus halophilus]
MEPARRGQKAMYLTLEQAAKETGKSKDAIAKAIQAEQLPVQKGEQGQWQIDSADLFQVFPQEGEPVTSSYSEPSPDASPRSAEASPENPLEPLAQEIQQLRQQLQHQAAQAQERYQEWKHLMEQEANERQRLIEALAAPLEEENQQLRQALEQAQKKNRDLKHRLAEEAKERRQLTEKLTESQSPPQPAWARWLNRGK